MRKIIALAAIHDKRILLVEERGVWKLPGGTAEEGESDLATLCREMQEELPSVKVCNPQFYGDFKGVSVASGDDLLIRVYKGEVEGNLSYSPDPDLNAAAWVRNPAQYTVWPTTRAILEDLRTNGYL